MTREEAIRKLQKQKAEYLEEWVDYSGVAEAYDMAIEALSAEAVQGWIPCSERLPDMYVEVITTTDWSEVLIAWLRKDGTWEADGYIFDYDEILAWMPLPEPYKGGDSE